MLKYGKTIKTRLTNPKVTKPKVTTSKVTIPKTKTTNRKSILNKISNPTNTKSIVDKVPSFTKTKKSNQKNKNTRTASKNKNPAVVQAGANLTNLLIQTGAGVVKFGEGSLKSMLTVLKGIDSLMQKLDNLDGRSNVSEKMRKQADKGSKEFLAKEHTQSALKKFYEENKIGKVLEETANKPFKKEGKASAVAQGVGSALPSLVGGKISKGGKVVVSMLNSIPSFGKGVGEYLAQKKKKDSKNWTSDANFAKAIEYGASVSLFDNVVDGKIGDKLGNVSKYGTVLKTAYDTTSATLADTAKKISTGASFKEAWKESGGVASIVWDTAMLGTDKTKKTVASKKVSNVDVKDKTSKISNLKKDIKLKKEVGNKVYNKSKDVAKNAVLEEKEDKKKKKTKKTSYSKNPNKTAEV